MLMTDTGVSMHPPGLADVVAPVFLQVVSVGIRFWEDDINEHSQRAVVHRARQVALWDQLHGTRCKLAEQ